MVFNRCFYGEARTTRRYRLQQEAIYIATIDEIHEHLAVIAATGND